MKSKPCRAVGAPKRSWLPRRYRSSCAYRKSKFDFWDQRPDLPTTKITQRPEYLDELSAKEKLDIVRREMKSQGADAHFASNLESVARTLNIRAFDVHCNLLCFSYLLVLEDRAILYAQLDGISVDLIDTLEGVVEFADYDQIADVLVDELKVKLLVAKRNSQFGFGKH